MKLVWVERQEKDCRELAQRKGWEVVDTFIDNDLSAATSKRRPEYHRLLTAIEAGAIDAVIVSDLDRLYRRPIELEEFFAACDAAGLRHLATVGGDVGLSTGEGVLVVRIMGAVAAEEVRKLKARVTRKHAELAYREQWACNPNGSPNGPVTCARVDSGRPLCTGPSSSASRPRQRWSGAWAGHQAGL